MLVFTEFSNQPFCNHLKELRWIKECFLGLVVAVFGRYVLEDALRLESLSKERPQQRALSPPQRPLAATTTTCERAMGPTHGVDDRQVRGRLGVLDQRRGGCMARRVLG